MRMRFLVYLAAGYVCLVLAASIFAGSLIFFPRRELDGNPSERGLPFEDVSFRAGDGTSLHGWFLPGKGRGTVLFCHGNAGNISHRMDSLEIFHRLGLSVEYLRLPGVREERGEAHRGGCLQRCGGSLAVSRRRPEDSSQ